MKRPKYDHRQEVFGIDLDMTAELTTPALPAKELVITDSADVALLKERCLAFGIDATNQELIAAGMLLLTELTETALEVAMLQSMRANRSLLKRRVRR